MTPEAGQWALLALATVLGGAVRGFTGFGGALVLAPCFALVLAPADVVVLVSLIHLLASFWDLRTSMRQANWKLIAPMALASCLLIPLGLGLLQAMDPTAVKKTVAALVVLCALSMFLKARLRIRPSTPASLLVGSISGVLNGLGGIGGPPAVLYVLAGADSAAVARASFLFYFAILYAVTLLVFLAAGAVTGRIALAGVLAAPLFVCGSILGARLFSRTREERFVLVCAACLAGLGIAALLQ